MLNLHVLSGEVAGVKGPIESLVPIVMTEILLGEGAEYTHVLPENHNAFLFMLAGKIEFDENKTRIAKSSTLLHLMKIVTKKIQVNGK